ncbi:MAG TPA: thioredoxin domain-containing protein [Pyrinomonadaceae bacterium]|nr:thioredoxin domain-containing protein [Pyrinomonadaceae bacterium]
MRTLVRFALILTLSLTYFPCAQSSTTSTRATENWFQGAAGYERALELQKELHLPLVVYFWADWCPYCQALDTRYLPTAPVQDYLRGVIKVRIAPEEGRAERMLAKQYNVKGYPAFFIIRAASSNPVKVHPFNRSRSWTPEEFAEACQKAGPIPSDSAARRNSQTPGSIIERQPEITAPSVSTKRSTNGGVIITVVPVRKN